MPHNLELAAFSPSTINVMLFDHYRGADQCRSYACKYCGQPEPGYYLETDGGEANPVKRFLQCRNVGLCVAHNRLLGFRVVRSTVSSLFLWSQFTVDAKNRIERSPEHIQKVLGDLDPDHYLNHVQKCFFRGTELAHLRPGQFSRYFVHNDEQDNSHKAAVETKEEVEDSEEQYWGGEDNATHRHYDSIASGMEPGSRVKCQPYAHGCPWARRRQNRDLCVPREPPLEPSASEKEQF